MKKIFVKLSMLLFVLVMSTTAWAAGQLSSTPMYSATLTANVSSTGGGKVYVTEDDAVPSEELYAETDSKTKGLVLSMQGMDRMRVAFWVWQMADDGYYFAGWSYTDNGFDLGKGDEEHQYNYYALYDVNTEKATYDVDESGDPIPETFVLNPEYYTIYATFEPVRITGYSLSGGNTNAQNGDKWESTQTVTYTFSGEDIDEGDFESIAIVPADAAWTVNDDFTVNSEAKTGTVSVKFSTSSDAKNEYSANLRLTTKAGLTMNITLNARTSSSAEEKELALYDGKTYKEDIDWSELSDKILELSCTKPLIKLNKDRAAALELSSDLSIDLAGHTIPSLTVNAGANVTLVSSPYGGSITGNVTNNGTLTLMGNTIEGTVTNNGTLNQNGTTIEGAVTNNGTMTTTDGIHHSTLTSTGTLVVNGGTFEPVSGVAINVTSGTADIKKGTIIGITYGVQSAGASTTTTIEKLAVISGGTKALSCVSGTLKVNCGQFQNPDNLAQGTIVFKSAYFLNATGAVDNEVRGKHLWRNTSGAEFRNGYEFFAGDNAEAKKAGVSVCHIGGTSYSSLEDALDYANNTSDKVIIIMDNDYTLPAGYYTLPNNAVLIVPNSDEQGNENKTIERVVGTEAQYATPEEFRCLTLNYGVNIDVYGTIEVGGLQFSSNASFASSVYGSYGRIRMNEGSKVTLQSGSILRAWGYITGDIEHKTGDGSVPMGEIDARRGATVYEQFQMGDWKGARFSGMGLLEGNTVFPLTTYFIQNIEAPVKYHPGAKLITVAGVTAMESEWGGMASIVSGLLGTAQISMSANNIQIIGVNLQDVAMFLMDAAADAENTWVRKWYDASKDQQVYEINSGAHIGNLVIPLVSSPFFTMVNMGDNPLPEDLTMNSGQYDLPITNNFKLHLLSGTMDFTQSTELLPGSEVEIDKEAKVWVNHTEGVNSGALYVYDADDWGTYAGGVKARRVKYSPAFEGEPNVRDIENLEDATILVHGTFDIIEGGYVYTSEQGANICSTNEDAGTFTFTGPNTTETKELSQVTNATGGEYATNTFYPAKLRNKDGSIKETSGMQANHTCIYMNDAWSSEEIFYFDCYAATVDMLTYASLVGQYGNSDPEILGSCVEHIYIKPQEWVEIVGTPAFTYDTDPYDPYLVGVTGNDDHTYSDADGAGRLFIVMDKYSNSPCQWWEVEQKDNYYHCIHPENDTYYYWNESRRVFDEQGDPMEEPVPGWSEVEFTITWKDKKWGSADETQDSILQTYTVPYGTQAEWLSTNPTRPANADYTYNFIGWGPELGKVTSDVTYTATYEERQIKYTITFVEDGGVEIERHLLARNEWPVCENLPTRTGYTLEWTPAIAAVTGEATYTATWVQVAPDDYAIEFRDYNGTLLKPTGAEPYMVDVDTMPVAPANPANKPSTIEYDYVFDHWSPAIEAVSATSAKIYTAVYREIPRTYTISYYNEAGTATIGTQILSYGETPTPPDVTKEEPAAGMRYTYVWKTLDGSKTIETVTGDADYKPVFSSEPINYSVSVKSNPSGACTIAGVGTYHYGDPATITLTKNDDYTFDGWSDLDNEDPNKQALSRTLTITQDTNLVANFTYDGAGVTIYWKNEAGTQDLVAPVNQKVGTATTYLGEIPTKAATAEFTYTFYGWVTKDNEGNITNTYKNGMTPKVSADATYYAYFTATRNQYTVTLRNAIAGACEFRGAGVRDYGATVNIVATPNGDYEFVKWQETGSTQADFNLQVTKDVTLTAVVKEKEKPAPANLELGLKADPVTIEPSTDYTNVIITSDGIEHSSQIINANNITLYGNADYVLQQAMTAGVWYSVAVPWRVEANGGIYLGNSSAPAELGKDIEIIYYDGAVRAAQGKVDACWVWMKKSSQKVLEPGRAYMFLLRHGAVSKVTFRKKALEPLLTTTTSVSQYASATATDANWNAIANPSLFHAFINAGANDAEYGVNKGQVYDAANERYVEYDMSSDKLVVGQPIYVQAAAAKSIVANSSMYAGAPARHASAQIRPTTFELSINANGASTADKLTVRLNENKEENKYIIGQDLVKFGVSTKVAQMWINRYDAKLCVNTIAPEGDVTTFPMSIYAPKAGEYTIAIEHEENTNDYALYLTYNGEAIWNLSDGAYTLNLNKGTISNYGLRVSARAPQVTTGVDEAIVEAQGETAMKVLINNQVFIIRGNRVYSVDGQLVK
ncbi:MAG: hypothetical protein II644_02215 [Paludibacteraceae bacterium]|nr:hypothetical protein [Paludibacteraceae bacterium]